MATSTEIGGVTQWPTTESFDRARRALNDAYNELENLTFGYRQLSGEHDPADVAAESVPVPADAIAAVVEFTEEAEINAQEIVKVQAEIAA